MRSNLSVGETASSRILHPLEAKEYRRYLLMLVPAFILLLILFIWPLLGTIWRSVFGSDGFTLQHYHNIFVDSIYRKILFITFRIATWTTIACLILGYPVAYTLIHASPRVTRILMIAVILPYFTSVIVRSFAFIILLGREGVLNNLLISLHLINHPLDLMYNEWSVIAGMTYVLLPFMIITIYTVMRGIDRRFMHAAYSMGASKFFAFRKIFLPLSLPGVAGGVLLVFILAIGFYITPALMGGPSEMTVSMLIEREVEITLNWTFASAMATVLLIVTLVIFVIYSKIVKIDKFLGVH